MKKEEVRQIGRSVDGSSKEIEGRERTKKMKKKS
jgi:hypothetical protein